LQQAALRLLQLTLQLCNNRQSNAIATSV
jgi:hypothetical protein